MWDAKWVQGTSGTPTTLQVRRTPTTLPVEHTTFSMSWRRSYAPHGEGLEDVDIVVCSIVIVVGVWGYAGVGGGVGGVWCLCRRGEALQDAAVGRGYSSGCRMFHDMGRRSYVPHGEGLLLWTA